jgi:hypothetical protein
VIAITIVSTGGAMFGRETRMLLRHWREQGTSKKALARRLGVSRDMGLIRFSGATWSTAG